MGFASETDSFIELYCPRAPLFFHLYDDVVARDEEGTELPGARSAHDKAIREARNLMSATIMEGHIFLHHRIEVEDDAGAVVAVVPFGDAVRVE